jgi:uncharacterized protein YlzI (FlbEa/FlbD family)
MLNRIKVTNMEGTSIFVATDHIVWVRPMADDARDTAEIKVITGDKLMIKESANTVLGLIDRPKQETM